MTMIIPKQTAAMTDSRYFTSGSLPKTIKVAGDLLAQTIAVYEVDEDGDTKPLCDDTGTAVTLTATSQPLTIDSPIALQFVKGVTTNECGVQMVD